MKKINWSKLAKLKFSDLLTEHQKEVRKLKKEIRIADLKGRLIVSLKKLEDE